MTIDKAQLKALAEAANAVTTDVNITMAVGSAPEEVKAVQDFLQQAMPKTILALLAEIERLEGCEEVLRQLASYVGSGGYNAPEVDPEVFAKKILDGINILNDPLAQLAEKRAEERDQLKAENEALRYDIKVANSVVLAEKKDAERYRWLRALPDEDAQNYLGFANQDTSDQEIDEAMSDEDNP